MGVGAGVGALLRRVTPQVAAPQVAAPQVAQVVAAPQVAQVVAAPQVAQVVAPRVAVPGAALRVRALQRVAVRPAPAPRALRGAVVLQRMAVRLPPAPRALQGEVVLQRALQRALVQRAQVVRPWVRPVARATQRWACEWRYRPVIQTAC